jgi:hypothetical protein
MTLEINLFRDKRCILTHNEICYPPSPDDVKELVSALNTLSRFNVIVGYHLKIDTYSPHME